MLLFAPIPCQVHFSWSFCFDVRSYWSNFIQLNFNCREKSIKNFLCDVWSKQICSLVSGVFNQKYLRSATKSCLAKMFNDWTNIYIVVFFLKWVFTLIIQSNEFCVLVDAVSQQILLFLLTLMFKLFITLKNVK